MCICCCLTRKSLLIYSIIISAIAFIYGIVAISNYASKTDNYKILKEMIDSYEKYKSIISRRLQSSYYNSYINNNKAIAFVDEDAEARYHFSLLKKEDFDKNSYGLIKRLKGIENGLGSILFIFPIIFFAVEIFYFVFVCGIGETQVLKTKTYNILYYVKIIIYTLSIIFIFLSIAYSFLMVGALIQYLVFAEAVDSCAFGIMYGMVFGYYGFWYYITLSCIFGRERQLFIEVGCQAAPGIKATYDVNGNFIVRAAVIPSPQIVQLNPYVVGQPMNIPYQQVQVYNRSSQFNPVNQNSSDAITQQAIIQQEQIQQSQRQQEQIQQPQIQQEQIPQNQNATSGRRLSNRKNNDNNQ